MGHVRAPVVGARLTRTTGPPHTPATKRKEILAMASSYVTIDKQGPVAVVRFDRRENLNAFNQQLVRELTEVAATFHDDLDTHYIVLAGAAEAFSAGAD